MSSVFTQGVVCGRTVRGLGIGSVDQLMKLVNWFDAINRVFSR